MTAPIESAVLRLRCSGCDAGLKLKGNVPVGKIIGCPKCGTKITIPGAKRGTTGSTPPDVAGDGRSGGATPATRERVAKAASASTEDDWLNDLGNIDAASISPGGAVALPPRVGGKKTRTSLGEVEAGTGSRRSLEDVSEAEGGFSLGGFGPFVTALLGGVIGGMVGAAIWAGIAIATDYEIGWIAWGVGVLAGFGVRAGSGGEDGPLLGGLAVLIACLSIMVGRMATIFVILGRLGEFPEEAGIGFRLFASMLVIPFTFDFWSVLWMGLAGLSAFKIGSGLASDD